MRARKKSNKYVLFIDGGIVQSKPTEPEKKTDYGYGTAMQHLLDKKGGTAELYEDMMSAIAYHETGPQQRMKADAIQLIEDEEGNLVPKGVGRGMFMFEAGEKAGGITAVNRTVREFKENNIEIPEWLETAYKSTSLDASTLTPEQQKVLFIGNYLQHPQANLGKYAKGEESIKDFWGKYHHAGGATTDYSAWEGSYKSYLETKK